MWSRLGARVLAAGILTVASILVAAGCKGSSASGDGNDAGVDAGPEAVCGDGLVEGQEECDDGPANSDLAADACRGDCRLPRCGDRTRDSGEECDSGSAASDTEPNACRTDCRLPVCGDGVTDTLFGETCDNGDHRNHDGCHSRCLEEVAQWTLVESALSSRIMAAATWDATRGTFVLFGGFGEGFIDQGDTWEYNGESWSQLTPLTSPSPRSSAAMAFDAGRGVVVLFGGLSDQTELGDTWEYDGTDWTEVTTATLPAPRRSHGVVYASAAGRIIMFGGSDGTQDIGDTWEYDGTDWTEVVTTGPPPRGRPGMAESPSSGLVVLFSGWRRRGDTWEYDPVAQSWTERFPAASPPTRDGHVVTGYPGGVVVYGGDDGAYSYSDTWTWDGATWTERTGRTSPGGRSVSAAAFDPQTTQVYLFGGRQAGQFRGDLWRYDGTDWFPELGFTGPSRRRQGGFAWSAALQRAVLFGGRGFQNRRDTWTFDGTRWTLAGAGPSARFDHALAPFGGPVLLFGGYDGTTLGDTWTFGVTGWVPRTPGTTPPARAAACLAYDAARGRAVLYGGWGATEPFLGDTWEYDGTDWTEIATTNSPGLRRHAPCTYDATRQAVVLFGGYDGTTLGDTWLYDGTDWTELVTATSPPRRSAGMMAYLPARETVLLFGGWGETEPYLDDTWELAASTWRPITTQLAPLARRHAHRTVDPATSAMFLFGGTDGFDFSDTWRFRWDSEGPDEACDNGSDDDGDGLVDCADPDCAGVGACP